jgi:hypothetical protein
VTDETYQSEVEDPIPNGLTIPAGERDDEKELVWPGVKLDQKKTYRLKIKGSDGLPLDLV